MIDNRAVVDPQADIDEGVTIGPFSVVGAGVRIGKGTEIAPHSVIKGPTVIGQDCRIFQFSSIGEDPQDKKYAGEMTRLEIGDRNVVREYATIHRGTVQDKSLTRIGSDNLLMAYTHVAHDCVIGDNVIMANAASLGGHVHIDDWAILGGFTIVHQFCRIGCHSFCAMGSALTMDLPPFVTVSGHPASPHGINSEGLRRRGFSGDAIQGVKRAYKLLYKSGHSLDAAVGAIGDLATEIPEILPLLEFLSSSRRGVVR